MALPLKHLDTQQWVWVSIQKTNGHEKCFLEASKLPKNKMFNSTLNSSRSHTGLRRDSSLQTVLQVRAMYLGTSLSAYAKLGGLCDGPKWAKPIYQNNNPSYASWIIMKRNILVFLSFGLLNRPNTTQIGQTNTYKCTPHHKGKASHTLGKT